MKTKIENYLDRVRHYLRMDPAAEMKVLDELRTHFQEKVEELTAGGLTAEAAIDSSIRSFGRARSVARLMYEAHSRGTWIEAFLAAIPHFLIASLFSFHLWRHPVVAPFSLVFIVCVTLLGWWKGKPNWLYSWVGYSMAPLIIGGYRLRGAIGRIFRFFFFGSGQAVPFWLVMLVFVYCGVSLWIILSTALRVIRRDWVLSSLMLVPLPIIGGWLHNITAIGGLFQQTRLSLHNWDLPLAYVFALLGIASIVFIRLRQRIWKAAAVITIGVIAGAYLVRSFWEAGFFSLLLTAGILLVLLLLPALLETRISREYRERRVRRTG